MPDNDIRPIPDPTVLTTEASIRQEAVMRSLIKSEITHLTDLIMEKLTTVDMQFRILEARTAEQKQDTKNALDAALAAQKEAVASQTAASEKSIAKSETATTERIKGVEALLATSTRAIDDKISDLKDRVIAIESIKLGSTESVANSHASNTELRGSLASIISIILAIITIGSVAIAVLKP